MTCLKCFVFLILTCTANLTAQNQYNSNLLWDANWSADGRFVAVGGDDSVLRIYDGTSFELFRSDTLGHEIKRLRWHQSKNLLAVAASESGSCIIDFDNEKKITLDHAENIGARAISWSPDGDLIAIADFDGNVTIWDTDGKLFRSIRKGATKSYVAVDWHPKRSEFIALSEKIRFYDISGQLTQALRHRAEDVLMLCIEWHPSGEMFVVGDYGDTIFDFPPLLQFRAADGTLLKSIDISKAEYRNVSWSNDGQFLASASDKLRIWSKTGDLLHEGDSPAKLWGVDWSPDGKKLVTTSHEGDIRIWNNFAEVIKELDD